ncbi:MAG TPA: dTDP-4-dehydrorhamnose 3,5-epimerase [Kiloniellaceae bacterium]|nr:dTDP-4-dehydrorhamnose 3,5-epimerase [Kiloniellaceae bacterium]
MTEFRGGVAILPEVRLITGKRHRDDRGHFCETFHQGRLAQQGIECPFVQDNESLSLQRLTLRGLHFQTGEHAQAKLMRVVAGAVFDVVVDLRRGSPRFGCHQVFELSAEEEALLFVPEGFGHGFCTLEDRTLVHYKVSRHHAPDHDSGLRWDDPDLAIAWPLDDAAPILSEKDRCLPRLRDHPNLFTYAG